MAAEYEVNIKINSQEIERELGKIDRTVAKIGKPKGGGSRRKPGIAGLLPSSEELRAAEKGIVQLTAKTKNIQSIQDKFSERRTRALARSNALNEKDLRLNRQLTAEARTRLRLLSQAGAKGFDGTRPQGRQLANDIDARAKAQEKRAKLANKINEMEAKGLNVAKLRKQLGKATTEQARGRFAGAQKEFRLLQKTIELEQSKLRIQKEQGKTLAQNQKMLQGVAKAGMGSESVFGPLRQLGQASMVAGANEAKLLAGRFRAPSSPLTARPVTRASAAQAAQQVEELVRARAALEKRATDDAAAYKMRADKRVHRAQLGLDQIEYKNKIDDIVELTNLQIKEGERAGRAFDKELKRRASVSSSGLTGQTSPIRGGIFQKGSPNQKRFEGVALGAGFPALFGGGAGSILGGGLGGLTGSFGAQIALSAIGQQIDRFIASVAAVGTALTSASGTVEMFREKNLFSSDAVKEHAFQLEEQGKMQELATLLTKDLASQIGKNAVESFQLLGGETKEFLKTINHLFLAVQGFVAGPLAKLLSAINTVLGGVSTDVQFGALRGSLTGDAAAQFEAIIAETRGTRELTSKERQRALLSGKSTDPVEGKLTTAVKEAVLKDPRVAKLRQAIDVTGQTTLDDTLGFKPPKDAEAEKAAREEARIQKRLGKLEEERKKVLEISRFKDKITAAEAAQDKQLVIRLKGEQQIAEIEAKRKQDLVDITDQRLIDQININAATEKLAAHRDTERELAEFQKTSAQERFDLMQKHIEQQYELNEAVKQQAALAEGIAETLGQGMAQSFDALIDGAQSWGAALQDIAANVLRDIAKQLIQIYVIEQAVGFLRAYLTPFSPSTPLGAGGGQVGRFGTLGPNYGVPQFANGGNPPVGRPSIVGERGPELFVPRTAGTIVPNHAMGGANVVVNVDASGSSAQGDGQQAKALGSAIGAAVQAELIKQKRPGGLLAS